MTNRQPWHGLLLLLACSVAHAGGGSGVSAAPVTQPQVVGTQPIRLSLLVPRTLLAGQPITLTATLASVSAQPVELELGQPPQADFLILDASGRLVWNCLYQIDIATVADQYVLLPRRRMAFTCVWSGRSNQGAALPPGSYTVRALVGTTDTQVLFQYKSEARRFSLR